jgi:hypothetical protein
VGGNKRRGERINKKREKVELIKREEREERRKEGEKKVGNS